MPKLSRRGAMKSAALGAIALHSEQLLAMKGSGSKMDDISMLWTDFCKELEQAGQVLLRPKAPRTGLDQAEGVRYLSRLLRAALEMSVEASDPDFPRFFQLSNETIKIGADNPDNIYLNSVVAGDRTYRITGNRGTVPYLSFGSKANRYEIDGTMASTGELDGKDMVFEADGSFEVIVSQKRQGRNWLPLESDSSMILVRQTFTDKEQERRAEMNIRCVEPGALQPLTPTKMRSALKSATGFVAGTARTFAEWTELFMTRPNELLPWDQSFFQKGGGDPNIFYLHGYWTLKPGEAWVIETKVPDCRFWNFQADNWWMESLDYSNNPAVWTNSKKAKLNSDGTLTLVVAARDPGFGNWIDTTGHSTGTALLRWIGAKEHPLPTARIVQLPG